MNGNICDKCEVCGETIYARDDVVYLAKGKATDPITIYSEKMWHRKCYKGGK